MFEGEALGGELPLRVPQFQGGLEPDGPVESRPWKVYRHRVRRER